MAPCCRCPLMNVDHGGAHAANNMAFQAFMPGAHGAPRSARPCAWAPEVFSRPSKALLQQPRLSTSVGDEGGFAPDAGSNDRRCVALVERSSRLAIKLASRFPLALDVAQYGIYSDGR